MKRFMPLIFIVLLFIIINCTKNYTNKIIPYDDIPIPTEPTEPYDDNDGVEDESVDDGYVDEEDVICDIENVKNGYIIDCSDGKSYLGFNGEDDILIIEEIDPCGYDSDNFNEILFRLENGEVVLAYLHKKHNEVMFKILDSGTYKTNDSQKCPYEVTEDGEVYMGDN